MKIDFESRGKYLLIHSNGRLDATWAEYFTDTLLNQIRNGRHQLVMDASQLAFLSSAGIRSLLIIHKALAGVSGRFSIVNATDFVDRTLRTCGFQTWLEAGYPGDMPSAGPGKEGGGDARIRHFVMNEAASLCVSTPGDWRPWQAVDEDRGVATSFPRDSYGLGIGSAAASAEEARRHFGEFLAVAGNVVYLPPDGENPPDYLIAEKEFTPRMQCLQALCLTGEMGHLIRFAPTDELPFHALSVLLKDILVRTGGSPAGFVILGEIEGLVGTALIRSPGSIETDREIDFPEIRDWLTFCGERCYRRQQALLVGVVADKSGPLLPPLPMADGAAAHIHGAVFPYQPLPNGRIELAAAVERFFNGPSPLSVMHLVADDRPIVGLGESALVRGGCWFSPLQNPEVLS